LKGDGRPIAVFSPFTGYLRFERRRFVGGIVIGVE